MLRPLAALAFAGSLITNAAWGFVEIARGELFFEGTGRVMTDSNIFGNATEKSDVIWTFEPALAYSRRAGRLNVDGRVGVAFNRFDDFSSEDSDDKMARIAVTLPTSNASPLQASFNVDYFKGRQVDIYLNDRIELDTFSVGFQGAYSVDPKLDLRFGADYSVSYPDNRANSSARSITVGAGYKFRPKVSFFSDYRFRRSKSEFDRSTNFAVGTRDHALFVGLTGDLSPVLTGTASVGAQRTDADIGDSGGDGNQLVAAVSLEWTPRQRTTVFFRGSSDTAVTNAASTVQKANVSIGANQKLGRTMTGEASIGWDNFRYRAAPVHSEHLFSLNAKLDYEPNKSFSGGAEITYFQRDPGLTTDFDRTTFSVFGTFKY